MRASELLGARVADSGGAQVGVVRDVLVRRGDDGSFGVAGLVVGRGRLAAVAHAWGFASGRSAGPSLLRKLVEPGSRRVRFVPASDVAEWGPGTIRLAREGGALPHLAEAAP